ncbi:DNA-3-methyladenine glycosylase I [Paenarthrobacter sp. Z7-10]|uniref:DNA-3-methyladenine glycosylase I n=1 Tax=Paenarthrobacter sp. Z7-10 TaxID=2787635 RepID=UPI0022A9A2AF|nr:DNA-3-methyladenine glycosylase I [Paenarthrobacter sp. Z7-10]MCZ2404004.1 DNA-3-methyladenine glycosylase I [Paenarthrobacter sp. Z7-10]
MSALIVGSDGRARCGWAGMAANPDYERYHDEEWGRPVSSERDLFERLSLEAFQSGLSWITILRKREAFRVAFSNFDPERVAGFDCSDVQRLLADAGIVRNAAKIRATIANAQALLALPEEETLTELVHAHRPNAVAGTSAAAEIPAWTVESVALAKALKKRGFRFVGPTTAYAMMQAVGVVNDHVPGCWVRENV